MKFLALQLGHNATAAIMEDGRILGVVSQEKFDDVKNSSVFPADAAQALCQRQGWSFSDIDHVLLSSRFIYSPQAFETVTDRACRTQSRNPLRRWGRLLERGHVGRLFPGIFAQARTRLRARQRKQGDAYVSENLSACGLGHLPVTRIDHHLCHARAAYHGFAEPGQSEPALVFTLDGEGDEISSTVSLVDGKGGWTRLASSPVESSLGWIYSATTRFLGMKMLEHEYKVMGLAPYAKSYYLDTYERLFKSVIDLDPADPMVFRSRLNTAYFYDYLVENAVGERFDNIAAAVQHLIEERVVAWIRASIARTGVRTIYTGGGVFMNVKLNKRIQEMLEVEKVQFLPSCGDESLPIGALYHFSAEQGMETTPLSNLYLGMAYSDDQIAAFLDQENIRDKFSVEFVPDIDRRVAELLAQREVVARFADRCEWGARSLGNRALLAHPSFMESFYTVNDQIKARDFWMPFAPSILDTHASRYLKGFDPAKNAAEHMITAYDATETGVQDLRAALHQGDHTLRPQVVNQKANPRYYDVISHFAELTGVGALLNTSLNLHGRPLVATPKQAMFTFENSGLRNLALGSYLVRKI
jgi:carbamoyltransferase